MQEAPSNPPRSAGASPLAATLAALPWEKVTLWAGILLAAYLLRHFVFIVLMTFLLCYVMHSVIGRVVALVSPQRERPWLERGLAVAGFALLLGGFTATATYVGPRLFRQANELIGRLSKLNPELEFQSVLGQTVGTYCFGWSTAVRAARSTMPPWENSRKRGCCGRTTTTAFLGCRPRCEVDLRTTHEAEAVGALRRRDDQPSPGRRDCSTNGICTSRRPALP